MEFPSWRDLKKSNVMAWRVGYLPCLKDTHTLLAQDWNTYSGCRAGVDRFHRFPYSLDCRVCIPDLKVKRRWNTRSIFFFQGGGLIFIVFCHWFVKKKISKLKHVILSLQIMMYLIDIQPRTYHPGIGKDKVSLVSNPDICQPVGIPWHKLPLHYTLTLAESCTDFGDTCN